MKKLAVILPGIGYHKDKPLLYYSTKLAQNSGYALRHIAYHDMPQKIMGSAEMIEQAAMLACQQTEEQLQDTDLTAYDELLLIGKSIGTIAGACFVSAHQLAAKQILYTPLLTTFTRLPSPAAGCIAFLGEADPWSDFNAVRQAAAARQIPLRLYPDCNHSLECADVLRNLAYLREVMQITADFINNESFRKGES